MTKPLVTFPDPEAAVVNYFRSKAIADTVTVSSPRSADDKEVTLTGDATHIQVELEVGGVEDYPVTERAQIRVTCYAAGPPNGRRSAVKNLASLAQGHLYTHPGDADVAGTQPLIGRSDVVTDPDTKNLMVWFTFRVSLKATLLAS